MTVARPIETPTLGDLIDGLGPALPGSTPAIGEVVLDSRDVRPGSVFVALPGQRVDGAAFVDDAVARGAVAVLTEGEPQAILSAPPTCPAYVLRLPGLRALLPKLARRAYGEPLALNRLIGVTGTNGKTTVAYLVAAALDHLEGPAAYIGTLGVGGPDHLARGSHTTPDLLSLYRALGSGAERFRSAALEVSSHALAQDRLAGVGFAVAGFLNLSRDHLDYHGTMAAYLAAKLRVFDQPRLGAAFVNLDDDHAGPALAAVPSTARLWGFTRRGNAGTMSRPGRCVRLLDAAGDLRHGTVLTLAVDGGRSHRVDSPLVGDFHVENLLAAFTALLAAGCDADAAAAALGRIPRIPGRLDVVAGPTTGPRVIVDYAHSPDALARLLGAVGELAPGPVTVVFGCGGDRDRGKRPLMGGIAARLASRVIVTTDNPRSEDPGAIADEIARGAAGTDAIEIELDRRCAIERALAVTPEDGVVVIAGKGHERWQEVAGVRWPFDDRAVARSLLDGREARR